MTTLSEQIRSCREGVVKNPFQSDDKKVLFVCSMGILRSATAARIYGGRYNTRSAGTWDDALIPLTQTLIDWADEVVFMTEKHFDQAKKKFDLEKPRLRVLNIPDDFPHMDPKLIEAFEEQYEKV